MGASLTLGCKVESSYQFNTFHSEGHQNLVNVFPFKQLVVTKELHHVLSSSFNKSL